MRPMFYEFPEDEAAWPLHDQYMFGPDVLVAPITQKGARSREVYLPKGVIWADMHSGETYQGGKTVSVKAPLERLPVFLRDGAHPMWIGMI